MCDEGYLYVNFNLPIGLSVLDLSPMYATDRQTDVRRASSLNALTLGAGHNTYKPNDQWDLRRCWPPLYTVVPL